jgi:hypothetical protein
MLQVFDREERHTAYDLYAVINHLGGNASNAVRMSLCVILCGVTMIIVTSQGGARAITSRMRSTERPMSGWCTMTGKWYHWLRGSPW